MGKRTTTKPGDPAGQDVAGTQAVEAAPARPETARDFAAEAARLLADDKCEDVVLLDVRDLSQVTDYIVIGSGTSERQMRSALTHVKDLGRDRGHAVFRSSDDERGTWLLADLVDVVVHVFEPNTRAHYDLEMLWGDAPRLEWQRTEAPRRAHGASAES